MKNTYELIPNANMLLESLRSVGYTEEAAIADIVDNSISAHATVIEMYFDWSSKSIVIADNGVGMSQNDLLEAMYIGSSDPNQEREEDDLGRFGMGMKTAAFSIAKKLIVFSKQDNFYANAEWDLSYVEKTNKWEVLVMTNEEQEIFNNKYSSKVHFSEWSHGTLIVLDCLDKFIDYNNIDKSKSKFYKSIMKIQNHIAMTFHRFIEEDNLQFFVNGKLIEAWNPFYCDNRATMELALEDLFDGKSDVQIEPYILPHRNKFSDEDEYKRAGGTRGWLGQQGFYVYRNRRLIVYGTWFGKFKKEPAYNLARIKLDMSSESDFEWAIDIKKSRATLPVSIEEQVIEIARLAIDKSVGVYNSRGTYNRKNTNNTTSLKYVWEQRKTSAGKYMFFLNKKHPLLIALMNNIDDDMKSLLKAYLSAVENFSPAMLSGVIDSVKKENSVSKEAREKDLITIKERVELYRSLDFDDKEIYDVISESPEYAYLLDDVKMILRGD